MTVSRFPLSEPKVRKALATAATELVDTQYPQLRLRIHKARQSGTWYLVHYVAGKADWHKLGQWPQRSVKQVRAEMPAWLARLAQGETPERRDFLTVEDLLSWYRDRTLAMASASARHRRNVKGAVDNHLLPRLAPFHLTDLDANILEEHLLEPLQRDYKLSYVRAIYGVLRAAFTVAVGQQRLPVSPLEPLTFGKFYDQKKIKPRAARLRPALLPGLLTLINEAEPERRMLLTLMLAHGTRIGETRQLRWDDFAGGVLHIPEHLTKTRAALQLPLTEPMTQALETYRAWQQAQGYRGGYLFPSGNGCWDESMASDRVRAVSQREWSAHDLRKLARTCWAEQGVDYLVAERLLNHALSKLDQAYIHSTAERLKVKALAEYHAHLQSLGWQPKGVDHERR